MAARLRAHVLALVAACAVVAATACAGDEHLPPGDGSGSSWTGTSGEPTGGDDGEGNESNDGGVGDAGDDTCTDLGGRCLSDPDDPTMPAFCEAMDQVEIEGACADVDRACCAPDAAGLCEAAGGQCLANPSGGGTPLDCADFGLVQVGAPCPTIDQICCG